MACFMPSICLPLSVSDVISTNGMEPVAPSHPCRHRAISLMTPIHFDHYQFTFLLVCVFVFSLFFWCITYPSCFKALLRLLSNFVIFLFLSLRNQSPFQKWSCGSTFKKHKLLYAAWSHCFLFSPLLRENALVVLTIFFTAKTFFPFDTTLFLWIRLKIELSRQAY